MALLKNDVWSKVVKAFVHETESIEDFDRINDQLFESSYQANRYANVLMPILGNLGNVSFVLTALIGGLFALNGIGGLTIWWSHGLLAIEPVPSQVPLLRSLNN